MTILDELMLNFSYTTPTIQNSRVSKIFLYEIILIFWQGYVTLIKSDKKNIYNVTKYIYALNKFFWILLIKESWLKRQFQ